MLISYSLISLATMYFVKVYADHNYDIVFECDNYSRANASVFCGLIWPLLALVVLHDLIVFAVRRPEIE